MPNIENIKKYKNIHMIGIGGVSMSGIAAILTNWGFKVSGSDRSQSESTDKLTSIGINVTIGHNLENNLWPIDKSPFLFELKQYSLKIL